MTSVFADTGYWIALLDRNDPLHARAQSQSRLLQPVRIFTSVMVLTELLNYFAGRGSGFRSMVVQFIERMQQDESVVIVAQTDQHFRDALELYVERADKKWSATDCASFLIMQRQNITQALAHDIHFRQAGFTALLRDD